MVDISDLTKLPATPPDQAAKNIDRSNIFDISADAYSKHRDKLDAQVDQLQRPTDAPESVRAYMEQSSQHTSLAQDSVEHLSFIDRMAESMSEMFVGKPTRDARLVKLANKKLWNPEGFSAEDQLALDTLNEDIANIEKRNYGLQGIEKPKPEMFSNFAEIAEDAVSFGGQVADAVVGSFRTSLEGAGRFADPTDTELVKKFISKLPVVGPAVAMGAGAIQAQFEMMAGSTFNALDNEVDANGQFVNTDHNSKRNISLGVATVSTALETIGFGAVLKPANNFLRMFYKPALTKELVNAPERLALKKSLQELGKALATEGTTESLQEVASIIGEEINRTFDGSEVSFVDGITNAALKWRENLPRIAESGAVGAAAGLVTAGPATVLGHRGLKAQYVSASDQIVNEKLQAFNPDQPLNIVQEPAVNQSLKVLNIREALENTAKVAKGSKMYELAPDEVSSYVKMTFDRRGLSNLWLNVKTWKEKQTDPAKLAKAMQKMGVPESVIEAPTEVGVHKMFDAIVDDPSILDHIQADPDGPTVSQAEKFNKQLQEQEARKAKIFGELGIKESDLVKPETDATVTKLPKRDKTPPPDPETLMARAALVMRDMETATPEQKVAMQKELDKLREQTIKFYTTEGKPGDLIVADWSTPVEEKAIQVEGEFLKSEAYTKAFESVIPEKERKKFNDAVLAARTDYLEGVREAARLELNQVIDLEFEIAMEEQRQAEMNRILNSPEFALVDKFMRERVQQGKKNVSIYAIDKSTLPTELLKKYGDDKRLNRIGIWEKGGLTVDQSAQMIGSTPEELLRTLAHYPTREEIVEARTKASEAATRSEIEANTPISHAQVLRALTAESKIAADTMQYLKNKEWGTTKKAIKRIALPMPVIDQIRADSYATVQKTSLKNLNPRQYRTGQKVAQREAVNAILKSEPAKAFRAKENEIINIEMQRASYMAIGKVNRAHKFIKKLRDPKNIEAIKEAGMHEALNEIMATFNLDPRAKGTEQQGSYLKFVKEQIAAGRQDFSIQDELLDVRTSVNDMTVEQFLAVADRLRGILHTAKETNRIYTRMKNQEAEWELENIRDKVHAELTAHPQYDPTNVPPVQRIQRPFYYMRNKLQTAQSLFTNMEFIVKQLDQEKYGGTFNRLIVQRLKGDGAFHEQAGFSLEHKYVKSLKKYVDKAVDTYGKKDYDQLGATMIDIPEFRESRAFNNGHLSKSDLIVLWVYGGDPDGKRKRSTNSGVSEETIQTVLDRELDERDIELAQTLFTRAFERYRPAIESLQKEVSGEEVTWIEGVPNTHRGKTYKGGYIPNHHAIDYSQVLAEKTRELSGKSKIDFKTGFEGRFYSSEQTEQGHLIDRVGSKEPLDLSFSRMLRSHEQVIHDLSYRKAGMDVLTILKDDQIKADIISTVGKPKYDILLNTVIELLTRADAENVNYFADSGRLLKETFGKLQSNFSITVLGLNPTSVAIQTTSIAQAVQNMGASGAKYIAIVNGRMAKNPDLIAGFHQFAQTIDPTIGGFIEQMDNNIVSNMMKMSPGGRGLFSNLHDQAVQTSMSFMGMMDSTMKTIVALASYEQFMNGDVDGWSVDRLSKMSEQERHEAAQAYVGQISRTSLTHGRAEDKASFQKHALGGFFANYWNDARAIINNQMTQGRKIKRNTVEAAEALREGRTEDVRKYGKRAAGAVIATVMTAMFTRVIDDWLHNRETIFDDEEAFDYSTPQKALKAGGKWLTYGLMSPIDVATSMTPIVRDIKYGAFVRKNRFTAKNVDIPISSSLNDIATASAALADLLEDSRDLDTLDAAQVKALLKTQSYLFFAMPINGPTKIWNWVESLADAPKTGGADRLRTAIKEWEENPPTEVSKEFKEDIASIKEILGDGN